MLLIVRRAKLVLFVACCGFASICLSVGFGNLKVNSYLSQPLSAEVRLTGVKDLDPFSLQAKLASPTDFDRAGISRTAALYDLMFEITVDDDEPIVKIRTTETIRSPYLEFLIELSWPEGKLVKSYIILLDKAPHSIAKNNKSVNKKAIQKVAAKPNAKPKVAKTQKVTVISKSDTPLLPNVVPDIDDVSIDVTKHELYKTPIISKTNAIIKTEIVQTTTKTSEINSQLNEEDQIISDPIIKHDVLETSLPLAATEPLPIPDENILPVLTKKIPPHAMLRKNYVHLIIMALLIIAGIAVVLKSRYASKSLLTTVKRQDPNLSDDISEIVKFSHIVGYSPLLQMKIDLAKQYLEIEDHGSARELLSEVIAVAAGAQKSEAQVLERSIVITRS